MVFVRFLFLFLAIFFTNAEVTTTVIDLLSQNVEFSSFLRLLQRNQLIPHLNQLSDFTLIAPVNSAFYNIYTEFTIDDLSHYIISSPVNSNLTGIHIFTSDNINKSPILATIDPESFQFNYIDVVEKDLFADSQNAYVQGINKLISYDSLNSVIGANSEYSVFKELLGSLHITNKTVLLPTNDAFDLEPYELKYLFSEFGENDSKLVLNSLLVDGFHGGDINLTVNDNNGYLARLTSHGRQLAVNETIISSTTNGLTLNSIYHKFNDSSLIQEIQFNALKYLAGLDAGTFVKELISQDLSDLITDNSINQTIFYVKDSDDVSALSKSSNLYHFVEEKIPDLSKAKNIYNTRYCQPKKFGPNDCQKIKIESIGENSYIINNNILVEAGPFEVGNTVIYLTDEPVSTPGNILSSVNPVFHCSRSLRFFYDLGLTKLKNNNLGYTIFLPCFDSYDDYELTLNYLEKDESVLEQIMRNFVLEGLVYTDIEEDSSLTLKNLNDENVTVSGFQNKNNIISFNFNNESMLEIEKNDDILFNQGVIHPVDKFYLPSSVNISLFDVVSNSDSDKFLELLKVFPELDSTLHDLNSLNYSVLAPLSSSFSRLDQFASNQSLKEFLQMHIIPIPSELYYCEDTIQTLNPKVNLTCQIVQHPDALTLQLSNNADHSIRVLRKGCVSSVTKSCVYSVDKPLNPSWLNDSKNLHIHLPALALGVGILLGSLLMALILICLMLIILKKRKEGTLDVTEVIDEDTVLLNEDQQSNSGNNRTFESGYSANSNVDPINVSSRH